MSKKKKKHHHGNQPPFNDLMDAALNIANYAGERGPAAFPSLVGAIVLVAMESGIPPQLLRGTFEGAVKTLSQIEAMEEIRNGGTVQ